MMSKIVRKLSIGVQSFVSLRNDNYVYVDKTHHIYNLVNGSKQYFLSRPRRFGKSLFLSTLKAYWEGKKELFHGLAMEELEKENKSPWLSYPVFYFDFNGKNYQKKTALEDILDKMLGEWENVYGGDNTRPPEERFQNLLQRANKETGLPAVVLVDEYDKPLLEVLGNNELEEHNKAVFKGFFSTLKSYDEYLKFVFITGVTKFSKVSIFSDLNQLDDISLVTKYSDICGFTEAEIIADFSSEIESMAMFLGVAREECLTALRKMYDGYHFAPKSTEVYNPFSLLKALSDQQFNYYWFSTGTPTFLVKKMHKLHFPLHDLLKGNIYTKNSVITDYRTDNPDVIPLLYQTGYLTITGYEGQIYQLGFPNEEVKYGFLESLLPEYVPMAITGSGKDILSLVKQGRCLNGK